MKYIVVYIIFVLGLNSLNVEAQKPTIDLLPTASESVHPEAMIDTCITHDNLILYDSISKADSHLMYAGDARPVIQRRTHHTRGLTAWVLYPLIFRKINTIRFTIYFTALKF